MASPTRRGCCAVTIQAASVAIAIGNNPDFSERVRNIRWSSGLRL
jgi:hypothetical protein